MTRTVQTVAFVLAAFTTLGTQYAAGQRAAQVYALTHPASQRVEVIGQRAAIQRVVIVGHRIA